MAQNESIVASLKANPVPSDRNCVRTGQDIVDLVQDYVSVEGLASASAGAAPVTNNTSQQALTTANAALDAANQALAAVKEKRFNATPTGLVAGDSLQSISWAPPMPDTQYEVRLTLINGNNAHPTTYYGWRLKADSKTESSAQIYFDNIPAASSYSWVVEAY